MSRIIDADAHIIEGPAFLTQALDRWPAKISLGEGGIRVEGRRYPEPEGPGAGCPVAHAINAAAGTGPASVEGMLADFDREGIDRAVLFPSFGLGVPSFEDVAFAGELAGFYNGYIRERCAEGRGRLFGVAVVPIEDIEASIKLMGEAKQGGLVCTALPPALRERNLDHPDLDRFYHAAEELDMPLAIHGAPGVHLPKIGVDRFTNYIQVHCISFPFDMMTAMTAMVSGGVLERHPGLRVAFVEAGVGWVPYFMDRLHEHYEKRGDWIEDGWKRDPREYLERGQIYLTCEAEESILPGVVDVLGSEFIMYASDYPHWDSEFPTSTEPLRERKDISDEVRAQIFSENARRFYRLG
ncbi:MAG: amidohydrolase family protein [Myxococcota bacterium]